MRVNQKLITNTNGGSEFLIVSICYDMGLLAVSELLDGPPKRPINLLIENVESNIESGEWTLAEHQFPQVLFFSDSELEPQWIKIRNERLAVISPLLSQPELLHRYLYGDASGILKTLIENSGRSRKYICAQLNSYFIFGSFPNSLLPHYFNCGSNFQLPDVPLGQRATKSGPITRYGTPYRGITRRDIIQIERFSKSIKSGSEVRLSELYFDYCLKYECVNVLPKGVEDCDIAEPIKMLLHREDLISPRIFKYHLKKFVSNLTFLKKRVGSINYSRDHAGKPGLARAGLRGPTSRYEIDSTIADVYIRYPYSNDELLSTGRPVIYFVVDTASSMIVGLHVGFDSPCWHGASQALFNAMSSKQAFCRQYGVEIEEADWPCNLPCRELTFDRGSENTDTNICSLLRGLIGITVGNFNAYHRGDMKGQVEKTFDIIQTLAIPFEAGKVVKYPHKEDQHASRRPLLTYEQFMYRLINIIIYSNNHRQRVTSHNLEMSRDGVGFTPRDVWNWGLKNSVMVRPVPIDRLRFALLPEDEATVRAEGIFFRGLYYSSNEIVRMQWLDQAKNLGRFKIRVRYIDTCTNYLWFKTEESDEVYQVELTDRSEVYRNQVWANVMHRLYIVKQQLAALDEKRFNARAVLEMDFRECDEVIRKTNRGLKKSTAKNIQSGMKSHKQVEGNLQRHHEEMAIAADLRNTCQPDNYIKKTPSQNLADPTIFTVQEK